MVKYIKSEFNQQIFQANNSKTIAFIDFILKVLLFYY